MAIGRPTKYTKELGERICAEIAAGKHLRQFTKTKGDPCAATIINWTQQHPEFFELYTRAMETKILTAIDEVLEISDDGSNDTVEITDGDGDVVGEKVNFDHIQRSRLRVDTRKWLASKIVPKIYGDKQEIEHKGQVDMTPIININGKK